MQVRVGLQFDLLILVLLLTYLSHEELRLSLRILVLSNSPDQFSFLHFQQLLLLGYLGLQISSFYSPVLNVVISSGYTFRHLLPLLEQFVSIIVQLLKLLGSFVQFYLRSLCLSDLFI